MKLLLHIGCGKGGSTSIQRFLAENAATLRDQSMLVPSGELGVKGEISGEQIWYFEQAIKADDGAATFASDMRNLIKAAPRGTESIVMSAENLCSRRNFQNLFAPLLDDLDIQVLFYIRRQDEYLESAWQQWFVKGGQSLTEWLITNLDRQANWLKQAEPWADMVGVDRLSVRRFGSQYFDDDLYGDYCNFLGIDRHDFTIPERDANSSYNADVSRWVEANPALFEGGGGSQYYTYLRKFGGDAIYDKDAVPPLFSLGEKRAIMRRYAAVNEQVRSKFLPDVARPLFKMPHSGAEQVESDQDRHIVALETQVFNLYKQLQRKGLL